MLYRISVIMDDGNVSSSSVENRALADRLFNSAVENPFAIFVVLVELTGTADNDEWQIVNQYHRDFDL